MFIITADQVYSRHLDDLAGPTARELNERYGDRLALPVDRNAGDEIQVLVSDAGTALALIADLTRTGEWSVVAYTMPGTRTSMPYSAVPFTFDGVSRRGTFLPISRNSLLLFSSFAATAGSGEGILPNATISP